MVCGRNDDTEAQPCACIVCMHEYFLHYTLAAQVVARPDMPSVVVHANAHSHAARTWQEEQQAGRAQQRAGVWAAS